MSKKGIYDYINQYNREKYDRCNFAFPKGIKEQLKSHAATMGESVSAFLLRAARAQMERDRAEDVNRANSGGATGAGTPENRPEGARKNTDIPTGGRAE